MDLWRKAASTNSWKPTDEQVTINNVDDRVELCFGAGAPGGRSDYCIQVHASDFVLLFASMCEALEGIENKAPSRPPTEAEINAFVLKKLQETE